MAELNYINIIQIYPGREDFVISEIRRQKRDVGFTRIALCCSWHPHTTPASVLIPIIVRSLNIIIAEVGDEVEVGALIQSTQGHGWSGKTPLTGEPFQRVVLADGASAERMCMADGAFRKYICDALVATAKTGVKFLLVDDDFGARIGECFCPLHIAEYNRVAGTDYSREELAEIIAAGAPDDPRAALFSKLRKEGALSFAREMREAIDSVNPELPCGYCPCGYTFYLARDVSRILAGKNEPFARICNPVRGNLHPRIFADRYALTQQMIALCDFENLIGEGDTFPQNYNSEAARLFGAHTVMDILWGLKGSKLWVAEYDYPEDVGSQKRYEDAFVEYFGMCKELLAYTDGIRWQGAASPLRTYTEEELSYPLLDWTILWQNTWTSGFFSDHAMPSRFAYAGECEIIALTGDDVRHCSEEEIKKAFTKAVLIDSEAAKLLSEKYSHLMGVSADEGDEAFTFTMQKDAKTGVYLPMHWEASAARLTLKGATEQVQYWQADAEANEKYIAPSITYFTNELGGRVAVIGWSTYSAYYKLWHPQQRKWILAALDFLAGGTYEMTVESKQQTHIQHGILKDGKELLAIMSLAFDTLETVPVRMKRTPEKIEKLLPEGRWVAVAYTRTGDDCIEIDDTLELCVPLIYRLTFELKM